MALPVYDVLIIGAGFAGLSAAISSSNKSNNIAVVASGNGASKDILAFNVPLHPLDDNEVYFEDMYDGGCKIGNKKLINIICEKSTGLVKKLENLGVEFTKKDNKYAQRHVSGGSYPRAIFNKDIIGNIIINTLKKTCQVRGVNILDGFRVIDIIKNDNLFSTLVSKQNNSDNNFVIKSKAVVLATGGIGNLYSFTTYPPDVWGDGYSLAYQLGAELIDMEFVQFEPTIAVYPPEIKGVVMPTALFGDGAILKNNKGERFLKNSYEKKFENDYHKDEMALAISREIAENRGTENNAVIFDTGYANDNLLKDYPSLLQKLKKGDIDLLKDRIVEVAPAAHSQMGGVLINELCETRVPGLFAAGEVTGGIHGANRLAGNAGTETLIMGEIAGNSAAEYASNIELKEIDQQFDWNKIINETISHEVEYQNLIKIIQDLMYEHANLVRNENRLNSGLEKLLELRKDIESSSGKLIGRILYLFNLSEMVLKSALHRKESRGYHFREDYPKTKKDWNKNIIISKVDNEMKIRLLT